MHGKIHQTRSTCTSRVLRECVYFVEVEGIVERILVDVEATGFLLFYIDAFLPITSEYIEE